MTRQTPLTLHGLGKHGSTGSFGARLHSVNGSPIISRGHEQIGLWLITLHTASYPQTPGQGSMHLVLTHALSRAQSELTVHSGLHSTNAFPKVPGKHSQSAFPLRTRHVALRAHGDGLQGSLSTWGIRSSNKTHSLNGSPESPDGQLQIGMWFVTVHKAEWPQTPGQGSRHLVFIQARFRAQSLLRTHSGRHPTYGSPWKSWRHSHTAILLRTRQFALLPQGDG